MLIIENATLLDLVNGDEKPGFHIAVDGSAIVAVSERPISSDAATRIDLRGQWLLPGLIDAHFHAVITETNPADSRDLPPTLMTARAGTLLRNALLRGFTTVRDMGGADWGLRAATAEGALLGSRLFIAGRAMSQTGGHGDLRRRTESDSECNCAHALAYMSVIADGVCEVRRAAREQLRQGADHLKVFISGGVVSPSDPLTSAQYTEEELGAIVHEAHSWGSYVAAHAYTADAISRAVVSGVRTIEHGNLLDAPSAALMATHGAFLVPTLVTYDVMQKHSASLRLTQASLEKLRTVIKAGIESVELALAAGVAVGFGTDLLGAMHAYQSDEFLIRARVQKCHEVLRSATEVNARILRQEGRLGVIAPGATADLVACVANPLRDLGVLGGQGEGIRLIIKDGLIVKNASI
jgi:imidazolonepropionase-like amidohydrolase